jgi:hypothetical protein
VGTLQTTFETCANEHSGSFTACTQAELEKVEPTVKDTTTAKVIWTKTAGTTTGYEIESEAVGSTDKFKLVNNNGEISRTCSPTGKGGCNSSGSW